VAVGPTAGCPSKWVVGTAYVAGSLVSKNGQILKCKSTAAMPTLDKLCNQVGFEPFSTTYGGAWAHAWEVIGPCPTSFQTSAPSPSPTTSKPTSNTTTSEPSSASPTTSRPTTSTPTTSTPSDSPSVSPTTSTPTDTPISSPSVFDLGSYLRLIYWWKNYDLFYL